MAVLVLMAVLLPMTGNAFAQATPQASDEAGVAIERAAAWLVSQQAADGGWVGFTGVSDPGVTIDAVMALVSAQNVGVDVDLTSANAYLQSNGEAYAESGSG